MSAVQVIAIILGVLLFGVVAVLFSRGFLSILEGVMLDEGEEEDAYYQKLLQQTLTEQQQWDMMSHL